VGDNPTAIRPGTIATARKNRPEETARRLSRRIQQTDVARTKRTQLLRALDDEPSVARGDYGTATLEAFAATWLPAATAGASPAAASGVRDEGAESAIVRVEVNDKLYVVRLLDAPVTTAAQPLKTTQKPPPARPKNGRFRRDGACGKGEDGRIERGSRHASVTFAAGLRGEGDAPYAMRCSSNGNSGRRVI
jgi:hypothetical protein